MSRPQTIIEWFLIEVEGCKERVLEILGLTPGPGTPVPDASEIVKGIAEIATEAETLTGTDDARIVTPLKLAAALTNIDFGVERLRIQFSPNGADATLAVMYNETQVPNVNFVAGHAATGIYTVTSPDSIFTDSAFAWGAMVAYGGSDYGFQVVKHSTTVIRIYTFNQSTGALVDVTGFVIPVLVDIYD